MAEKWEILPEFEVPIIELTTEMIKDMVRRYGRSKNNTYGWGVLAWSLAKRYLEEVLR